MITLRCPTCGKTLSIDDQYAGQAGKCNGCGGSILVPLVAAAPKPEEPDIVAQIQAEMDAREKNDPFKKPPVVMDQEPETVPGWWSNLNEQQRNGCIGCLVLLFIFAAMTATCHRMLTPSEEQQKKIQEERKAEEQWGSPGTAYYASQEFVSRRLVSPASAKFPRKEQAAVREIERGVYLITAYCDAKNKLGVPIRIDYSCQVRLRGENWICESLEMKER